MIADRKPVVVKFPVDLLAAIDAIAKNADVPRMVVIVRAVDHYLTEALGTEAQAIARKAAPSLFPAAPSKVNVDKLPPGMKAKAATATATTAPHVDIQLGPTPVVPGSRLKKGKLR